MTENKFVKKLVNNVFGSKPITISDRRIMHPERDWFLGILIGVLLLCLGMFWSVNTYLQFNNVSVTGAEEVEGEITYRSGLVESALSEFSLRKQTYEQRKASLLNRPVIPRTQTANPSVSANEENFEAELSAGIRTIQFE